MEKPKDRDFIETVEGLLFCVVGYLHPPDRYTAYLKYVPGDDGRWSREGTRYRRVLPYYHVSQVEKTYGYLGEHHPHYLYSCPVRNITVSSVPLDSVKVYYRPKARLLTLFEEGPEDVLEGRLVDLVATLSEISGLDTGDYGVTGSLLTESHSPAFSDMDLTIYGRGASRRLKDAILNAKEEGPIRPLSWGKKEEWSRSRSERHPLSFEDLMGFAERRWNYGTYEGTYFSVHSVRTEDEITEKYGDFSYTQMGEVFGEAEISDASESIYLPAIYRVEDVEVLDGSHAEIKEVVSYEGLFCDMFELGERVEFRGVLERVKDGGERHRVVIGGAGSRPGFMRLVSKAA